MGEMADGIEPGAVRGHGGNRQSLRIAEGSAIPAIFKRSSGVMKNLKLSVKLIGGFFVVVVLMAVLIATNLFQLELLRKHQDAGAERAADAAVAQEGAGMSARTYQVVADAIINRDMKEAREKWATITKETTDDLKSLERLADTAQEKEWVDKAKAAYAEILQLAEKELFPVLDKSSENNESIRKLDERIDAQCAKIHQNLTSFAESLLAESRKADQEFDESIKGIISTSLILGVVIALAGLLLGIFLTRSITKPVNRIIRGLTAGAEQVASASGQVSTASQSLAEGASEQAASIEETSSSLEEMSSMTKQNSEHANKADSLMKEANQIVEHANNSMKELTTSMNEITRASEETSKIIKTIDEIAFQTNLLALNAAVEAARAGEAGAGFAVVADEVRNLAMRASDAARNTSNLIEGTMKRVIDGSDLVVRANEVFQKVADANLKVGNLVSEIAAASHEQAQGIEQVNKAVGEMDKVVQQNASGAEESASASEEMNAQAEQMKGFVDELVAMVGGTRGGTGSLGKRSTASPGHVAPSPRRVGSDGSPKSKAPVSHKVQALAVGGKVTPAMVIPMDEDFKNF